MCWYKCSLLSESIQTNLMYRFTSEGAFSLAVKGRPHEKCGKPIRLLSIEDNSKLVCGNDDGFRLTLVIPGGEEIKSSRVECTLADGTAVACYGTIDYVTGNIRLDAMSSAYGWFWFEVQPLH